QLIPEALSEGLELPVEIRWGHIGLFHLEIPWNALGSRAVRATLEDVFLLVAPLDTWAMDDMERHRRARVAKVRKVETKLQRYYEKKALQEAGKRQQGAEAAAASGWGSAFWARLAAKVLDNVQVTVKNIHLRYEDVLSDPRGPLSLGLTLGQLSLQTTDGEWNAMYVQRAAAGAMAAKGEAGDAASVFKQVLLGGLALYCDGGGASGGGADGPPLTSLPESALAARFRELASAAAQHAYVVFPTSPTLRLVVRPRAEVGTPRYAVSAHFSNVAVVLNSGQVALLNAARATLRHLELWEAVRRHRPPLSPAKDPRAWWRFLVHCVGGRRQKRRPRLGWLKVTRLLAQRRAYVRLSMARAMAQATPKDYQEWTRLEDELTVGELVAFRILAQQQMEKEGLVDGGTGIPGGRQAAAATTAKAEERPPAETWGQWLFGWGGSRGAPAAAPVAVAGDGSKGNASGGDDSGEDASAAEADGSGESAGGGGRRADEAEAMDELARLFATDTAPDQSDANPALQRWGLTVHLNEGAVTLVSRDQPCLRAIFDVTGTLLRRKISWSASAALGALEVFDMQAPALATLLTRKEGANELPRADDDDGALGDNDGLAAAVAADDTIRVGDFQVKKSSSISVDFNPAFDDGGSDLVVALEVLPHVAVYSKACAEQVMEMLSGDEMQGIRSAAVSRIEMLSAATSSSLLHALGERQGIQLCARVHAPLLTIPDRPDDLDSCRLLLVDLGHIDFNNVPAGDPPAEPAPGVASDRGRYEGAAPTAAPTAAAAGGLVPEKGDRWRLQITGVEVVVCDNAKLFLEGGAGAAEEALRGSGARSLVERFDLTFAVTTHVTPVINQLTRLRMDAQLPRLSFNLDMCAYHVLRHLAQHAAPRLRLRPAAGELQLRCLSVGSASGAAADDSAASAPEGPSLVPAAAAGGDGSVYDNVLEKSMLLEQAATVLAGGLDEEDNDLELELPTDFDGFEDDGAAAVTDLSSLPTDESAAEHAAAAAEDDGGAAAGGAPEASEAGSEAGSARAAGPVAVVDTDLKFEVNLSAPLVLVTLGADDGPLLRASLRGIGGEYLLEHATSRWKASLASLTVDDLFQSSGPAFEQLLAIGSTNVADGGGDDAGNLPHSFDGFAYRSDSLGGQSSAGGAGSGVRVSCGSAGDGSAGCTRVMEVDIVALSANWNPETIAAVALFMQGMSDSGKAVAEESDAVVAAAAETAAAVEPSVDGSDAANCAKSPGAASPTSGEADAVADASGSMSAASPPAKDLELTTLVRIGRTRVSFNKELRGLRLVIATASGVNVAVRRGAEGSRSEYAIELAGLVLTDAATKHTKWRRLLAPCSDPASSSAIFTMSQDSRSTLAFTLRIHLSPVRVVYLNQTIL
ncbi:unnamed protein product, partial [Phaeothamnion confervicola]